MNALIHTKTRPHKQSSFVVVESYTRESGNSKNEVGTTRKYFKPEFPDRELNIRREAGNLSLARERGCPVVKLVGFDHQSITTEFVPGRTLQEVLTLESLPEFEKLKLFISALSCIGSLHNSGIIHGDTHPSNFIVTMKGAVFVCDFGLAHSAEYPFVAAPPTQARRDYFSQEQADALEHDIAAAERNETCWLRSNDLPPSSDFFIIAAKLLETRAFSAGVEQLLRKMTRGDYWEADSIIRDLEKLSSDGWTPSPLLLNKTYAEIDLTGNKSEPDIPMSPEWQKSVRHESDINSFFLKKFIKYSAAAAAICLPTYFLTSSASEIPYQAATSSVKAPTLAPVQQVKRTMIEREAQQQRFSALQNIRRKGAKGNDGAIRQLLALRVSQDKAESEAAEKSFSELFNDKAQAVRDSGAGSGHGKEAERLKLVDSIIAVKKLPTQIKTEQQEQQTTDSIQARPAQYAANKAIWE